SCRSASASRARAKVSSKKLCCLVPSISTRLAYSSESSTNSSSLDTRNSKLESSGSACKSAAEVLLNARGQQKRHCASANLNVSWSWMGSVCVGNSSNQDPSTPFW